MRDIVEKARPGSPRTAATGARLPQLLGLRPGQQAGQVLAPAGVTAGELIEEYCGGMQDGQLQGLSAGRRLEDPAGQLADLPLDFGMLEKYGCFVGRTRL